ncbi:MAG TPA: S-methyl-5-thioribose-1-phosphate isomerase, partial [Acidimicrobiia bacterium]|nr:S-methyl-5-thioribose-1-phosphate isomerase [Acidimicrobiia bacterium]
MPPTQPLQVATIEWRGDRLDVIDQTLLPGRLVVRSLRSVADVVGAIKTLVVRGAPAIGVCGAFGVVLGLRHGGADSTDRTIARLDEVVRAVGEARPTAANLAWAAGRVAAAARRGTSPEEIRRLALDEALRIRDRDVESCRRIGEAGRIELLGACRLLTHCNAGRLAAAGIGTALGIVYAKAAAGEPVEVIAGETRPLLQGSRLTAWELA